ncbi:SpoIIE family protein phosphatase [Kitasatospora sp. NPDC092948]|uniref:SpoIIE family protein phosphatase n=1 Tax=Kitasatospora sp. NPDC092948 TaxID=3364088 RepID=UPI0037FA9DC7
MATDDALAQVAELLGAPDLDELLKAAGPVLDRVGATASMVYLTEPDGWLELGAAQGYDRADADAYRTLPPDSPYPVAIAAREQRPVHQSAATVAATGTEARASHVSFAAFPLMVDGRCAGALLLELGTTDAPSPADRTTMAALATVCAHHATVRTRLAPAAAPLASRTGLLRVDHRHSRLEQAMTSADFGTFEWFVQTGTLIWDERTCRIFGRDPRVVRGRISDFTGAVHPEDRVVVDAAVRTAFRGGDYTARHRVVRPDGAVRWVEARGKVRFDGRGGPLAVAGVVRDCTVDEERRQLTRSATAGFAGALHVHDVADVMVDTVLPQLACGALAIHLYDDGRLTLAAARGYPPEALERLSAAEAAAPLSTALRSGVTQFIRTPGEYLAAYPERGLRPAPKHRAWAIVPLSTAMGPVGTCTLSYTAPQRFDDEQRSQLEGLTGILAQSLARAQLVEENERRMSDLQEMMLPRSLRPAAGTVVAVRYLPGTDSLNVGGDWYDVIPLPGSRTGVVVGDVQGHNARAAAVMGQMRTAVRAYASEGHGPSDVVAHTNRMLCDLETELLATACYAELDPAARRATVVRAGHPDPLLLAADGSCRVLAVAGGLVLGVDPDERYPAQVVPFEPGEALVLFTDGLVERPGVPYDTAMARLTAELAAAARALSGGDADVRSALEALADRVVGLAETGPARDDVAVLLAGCRPV